jgi:membrane protein
MSSVENAQRLSSTSVPYRVRSVEFLKHLWNTMNDDQMFNGAAALAFFLLLAIFPAAIFVLTMVPYLHIPHLQEALLDLLQQALPPESALLLDNTLIQVVSQKAGGLLTFGAVFTVWSASAGIYAVMQQLNMAYEVKETRPFWKVRGIAILLMAAFVVLVIGSFSLVIFGGVVQAWLASLIGWSRPLLFFFATLRWVIIAAALLLGISLIYRFGPDANCKFRYLSPGSVSSAALIAVASIGFRIYIYFFGNYNATYGSVGAIIILMLWLYLVGIALLVGGEINSILEPRKPRG